VTLLGGGFGRKSKPDYVAEAAILSKAVGKPVKVAWSREDDIRFDYYHTVSAMYVKAAIDEKGKPTAWLQRCAFPSMMSTFSATATAAGGPELGMGWTNLPFDIPNHRAENGPRAASSSNRMAAFGCKHPARVLRFTRLSMNWRSSRNATR
jgi:isoquinoline 1-oxidoreductase beta subunit